MLLKLGSVGKEVKKYKDMLLELEFLKASTHDRFGNDMLKAVKAYQKKYQLKANGQIDNQTARSIELSVQYNKEMGDIQSKPQNRQITQYLLQADYPNISEKILTAINEDLQGETEERVSMVKEALRWIFPYAIYIFGANLYKNDLTIQIPAPAYIDQRAKHHPEYFTNGRKEFMKKQYLTAVESKRRIGSADCSGLVVGILRKNKITKANFDTTANNFFHTYCTSIKKSELQPADLVFKKNASGFIPHMGVYIGAGYVIEAAGGAYGVQLSHLNDHILVNQMTLIKEKRPAWTRFGKPIFY